MTRQSNLTIVHDFIVGLGASREGADNYTELVGWIEANRAVKELVAGQADRAGGDGLRELVGRFPEINLGNYNDDDVEALNNWGLEIVAALAAPPSGNAGEGEGDHEKIATSWGWFKGKCGWYHPLAEQYPGWVGYPVCYANAKELCAAENLTAPPQPAPDAMREALEPFAALLDTESNGYESSHDDEVVRSVGTIGRDYAYITVGDLRRAKAALSSAPVPSGEEVSK